MVNCQINQIASLIKVSILKATHRESVRSVAAKNVTTTVAEEAEVARIGAANRTAPIAADGTSKVEPTITEVAAARQNQFKRRSKGPRLVITAPT